MARTTAPRSDIFVPALAYFALVFGIGFVLGSIRVPFLVPRLGVRWAELLEAPLMAAATFYSARFIVRRLDVAASIRPRVAVGATALALLVCAELVLAALLQQVTPAEYIASRDPISGPVYYALLLLYGAMPSLLLLKRN